MNDIANRRAAKEKGEMSEADFIVGAEIVEGSINVVRLLAYRPQFKDAIICGSMPYLGQPAEVYMSIVQSCANTAAFTLAGAFETVASVDGVALRKTVSKAIKDFVARARKAIVDPKTGKPMIEVLEGGVVPVTPSGKHEQPVAPSPPPEAPNPNEQAKSKGGVIELP